MRFFNAGVEVAHDGSPVPSTVAASSLLPTSPPPSLPLARSSPGRLGFPANKHDIHAGDAGGPFGVTGSGEVRGLPSFSVGGVPGSRDRPPSTPPEPWAENLPPDARFDPYALNRCGTDGATFVFALPSVKYCIDVCFCLFGCCFNEGVAMPVPQRSG